MLDYLKYYHQEQFLFEEVHCRFHQNHCIGAFDFFSIIIWKANRAKSKVAKRLQEKSIERNLDKIVRELTSSIHEASDHRERMRRLVKDWGFRLPMASAILTVFWPDDFTVYDVRACEQIEELLGKRFHNLADKTNPIIVWEGYCEYLEAVRKIAPQDLSLRDKDRYLWARSAAKQLDRQIEDGF